MKVEDFPTFTAASALAPYLRVKLSAGELIVCPGDEDELGTLNQRVLAAGDPVSIVPRENPCVRLMVAAGSFSQYALLYAAANGKVDDSGTLIRGVALEASTGDGAIVRVLTGMASLNGNVARANLVQDDLAVYGLDLNTWLATGTGQPLGTSAGTPSGAFGLTAGTHGTAAPKIVSEAASGASITNSCRRTFSLPPEYVAGETVTLRVRAKEAVGSATVGTTIDAEAYQADKDGGLTGSPTDLVTTNALAVTTSVGNKDFTINPTGLAPGDVLDIELTGVANDTGGSVGTVLEIYDTALLMDIQG